MSCRAFPLSYCFFDVRKRIAFKSSFGLYNHYLIIELLASLRFRIKEKIDTKTDVDVSRGRGWVGEFSKLFCKEGNDLPRRNWG